MNKEKLSLSRARPGRSKKLTLNSKDNVAVSYRMPVDLKKAIDREAKAQGLSQSLYINLILEERQKDTACNSYY